MLSFHGKEKIKEKYLKRLKNHYDADEFVKGKYWEKGKGCAVGCTIHGSDHSRYETEIGIPEWVARVEDKIFEGLPDNIAKEWPLKFLKSIPVGVDLNKIKIQFLIFIVESVIDKFDHNKFHRIKSEIKKVISKLKSNSFRNSDCVADANADVAAFAAYSACVSDGDAAAAAYPGYYASAAATATEEAADADGHAGDSSKSKKQLTYKKFSEKLIELIELIEEI